MLNVKTIQHLFLTAFMLLVFFACKKKDAPTPDPDPPAPPVNNNFPVKFIFISTDTNLKIVNIDLYTARPSINHDVVSGGYLNKRYNDPKFLGYTFKDTIVLYDNTKTYYYLGCLKTSTIVVKYKIPLNPNTNNNMRYCEYTSAKDPKKHDIAVDTIKTKADAIIYFRWPQDTVNYTKVEEGEYHE